MAPEVVNIRHVQYQRGDLFVGRKRSGMHFGNPFSFKGGTLASAIVSKDEVVPAFREWITGKKYQDVEPERRRWILDNLWQIRQATRLVCFCKEPNKIVPCHADVYLELI